jgi:putative pyruvate formate lyase activating enzyme
MLILPSGLAGVEANLEWIGRELSPKLAISLLAQYRPAHRVVSSGAFGDLRRGITAGEWHAAARALRRHMTGDRHHLQWGG